MDEIVKWFKANGLIQEERGEYIDYGIAWSNRSGYDFTTLCFINDPKSIRPNDWEVEIRHHQSGENPRMHIGTCETLAEIERVFETIRMINGYQKAEI